MNARHPGLTPTTIMTSKVQPLPTLPPEISDRSAWYGRHLAQQSDWIEQLSETEVAEVASATEKLLANTSVDLTSLNSDDFPLPTLGPRLLRLLDEVLNGRGFMLIRALP